MTSLVLTVRETLRYRGSIGQWSWVLHRLTGLGVVLFLTLHVIDTSWAVFYPELYEKAIASYQSPLFTIGEFGLVFAVIYHAFNGLRIAIFDFRPDLWKYQARAAVIVVVLTVLVLAPVFLGMLGHVFDHYGEENVFILPIDRVLVEQLPFAAGIVIAAIAAIILSALYSVVAGGGGESTARPTAPNLIERFWWSFMRISGVLIIPLVFGHLALVHVVQGVFDLTAADFAVVGTVAPADVALTATVGNAVNDTGTAVEFVAERWNFVAGGIYIWKIYDIALLALVTMHGFNGLRYVLTDYTAKSPMFRRAAIYFSLIGGIVLLVVGGGALLSSIESEAIAMAQESLTKLQCEVNDTLLPNCDAVLDEDGATGSVVDDESDDAETVDDEAATPEAESTDAADAEATDAADE